MTLRGGRDFTYLGAGWDKIVDRINFNDEHSPSPADTTMPFDDVHVGLTADETPVDQWQALLRAYASTFKEADVVQYSVAAEVEQNRLPSGVAQGSDAVFERLQKPDVYDKRGVEILDIADYEGFKDAAKIEGFAYLDFKPISLKLRNRNNSITETDILIGIEKIVLTEGAGNDSQLRRFAA